MQNPRECALDVLIKVDKKEELSHIAISNVLEKYQFSEKRDRAFFTRLVEGTLERQITIDYVADQFSKTKIRKCKPRFSKVSSIFGRDAFATMRYVTLLNVSEIRDISNDERKVPFKNG